MIDRIRHLMVFRVNVIIPGSYICTAMERQTIEIKII